MGMFIYLDAIDLTLISSRAILNVTLLEYQMLVFQKVLNYFSSTYLSYHMFHDLYHFTDRLAGFGSENCSLLLFRAEEDGTP